MAEDAAESGERKRPHLVSILPPFTLFFSPFNEAADAFAPLNALALFSVRVNRTRMTLIECTDQYRER